jgi:hypothetical protein
VEIPASHPTKIENSNSDVHGDTVTVFDALGRREWKVIGDKVEPVVDIKGPEGFAKRTDFVFWQTTDETACAVTKKQLLCTSDNGDYDLVENVSNPKLLTANDSTACVLDSEGFRCWSRNGGGTSVHLHFPKSIKKVRIGTVTQVGFCAIDEDGVKCWKDPNYPVLVLSGPNFQTLRPGENGQICTTLKGDETCWSGNVGTEDTAIEGTGVPNQHTQIYFHDLLKGYSLSDYLKNLAGSTYKEDKSIFEAALRLSQNWAPSTYMKPNGINIDEEDKKPLFLLRALASLIENIDSKKVLSDFVPDLKGTLEENNILLDKNNDDLLIAETLWSAGLRSLLPMISDPAEQNRVQAALSDIDRVLSQGNLTAAHTELSQIMQTLSSFLDQMHASPDWVEILDLIKWNQDFLEKN